MSDPTSLPGMHIPARTFLQTSRKGLDSVIEHCGDLSVVDCAQILNWIETKVPNTIQHRRHVYGGLVQAHACTIVLASRISPFPGHENPAASHTDPLNDEPMRQWLELGWKRQLDAKSQEWPPVDVDRECLHIFEERLFERSARAGVAGHHQWGCDTEGHQNGWNPYEGLPEEWDHEDYTYDESKDSRVATTQPDDGPPAKKRKPVESEKMVLRSRKKDSARKKT
ncbi:hypothetical protein HGRIS_011985 [Hohenbuehelia grisea]|uniref:Uncharacterized protein n=1 Tax=Hohenbuehelia grisea TaxID=104357 RepID=A0ABR3JWX3_9AGAR